MLKHRFIIILTVNNTPKQLYIILVKRGVFDFNPHNNHTLYTSIFFHTFTWCGSYLKKYESNELVNWFKNDKLSQQEYEQEKLLPPKKYENEITFSSIIVKSLNKEFKKGKINSPKCHIPNYDRVTWKYDTHGYEEKRNIN